MDICGDTHEEIAYMGRICPMCEAKEEISGLKEEIDRLEDEEVYEK